MEMIDNKKIRNRDRYIKLLKNNLKDRYNEGLVKELNDNGFFESPCSTKYHLAEEGGLLEHSLNVVNIALEICEMLVSYLSEEEVNSIVIAALLHDVGKAGQFGKIGYIPNILKDGKQSDKVPYEINKDLLSIPHEIRSIQIVTPYIDLTEDETFAILQHNGMYGDLKYSLSGKETKVQLIVHFADMIASRIIE